MTALFQIGAAVLGSPHFLDYRTLLPFVDYPAWFWLWRQSWIPSAIALASALVILLLPRLIDLLGNRDSRL